MPETIWDNRYILSNMDAQKLYTKSPLTTGVSGTSAWIGIEPSALPNETVLFFAGNDSSGYQSGNLTESIKNFETIKVVGMDNDAHIDVKYIYPQWTHNADNGTANVANYEVMFYGANPTNNTVWEKWVKYSFSALTAFTVTLGYEGSYTANTISNVTNNHKFSVREVIGINRKENV